MGLFGPPNLEKLKAKKDIKGLIKALSYQKDLHVAREDAALYPETVKDIQKAAILRREAARALGQIGDAQAVGPLIAALKDGHDPVRQAAAEALGQIGDKRAIEPLLAELKDKRVSQAAGQALTRLGWQPTEGPNAVRLWVAQERWDRCIEMGDAAVEPLLAALRDKALDRHRAVSLLAQIGPPAVKPLGIALQDRNRDVSWTAAQALGRIGDTEAKETLVGALDKTWDSELLQIAMQALALTGAPAAEPLSEMLNKQDPKVRQTAADALVKIGEPAIKPVTAMLKRGHEIASEVLGQIGAPAIKSLSAALKDKSSNVRRAALHGLAQIHDPQTFDPLVIALQDDDLRQAAVQALEQLGDPRAIDPLLNHLGDANPTVRRLVADALDKLGWQPDDGQNGAAYWIARGKWEHCIPIGTPAVIPLINALNPGFARQEASQTLAKIGRPAVDALVGKLQDKNPETGQFAVAALDKIGWQPDQGADGARYWIIKKQWERCVQIGKPAVEPLLDALNDGDPEILVSAAEALWQIGDERAVMWLIKALIDNGKMVRMNSARLLGQIGDARATKPLFTTLKDADEFVRSTAAEALGEIGNTLAVKPLSAALKDTHDIVRNHAAQSLGKLGDAQAIEPLVATLKDADEYVRITAARALVGLYKAGSLSEADKQIILDSRSSIIGAGRPHTDRYIEACVSEHVDVPAIPVDFPL